MENLVFGFVLFCVYFCTASCFLYSGQVHSTTPTENIGEPIEERIREMFRMIDEENMTAPAVATVEQELPQTMIIEEVNHLNHKDLIEALELEKLPVRKARPVCKALNIRQKVKGKNIPVTWLRVQIQQRLEEEPYLLPIVYEILEVPSITERRHTLSA